ncbi:hypothetical protein Lal_00020976, partial [Lupinus albus]
LRRRQRGQTNGAVASTAVRLFSTYHDLPQTTPFSFTHIHNPLHKITFPKNNRKLLLRQLEVKIFVKNEVSMRYGLCGCGFWLAGVLLNGKIRLMASSLDSWTKEYNEAVKLADDINGMISERSSFPASGPETQRHSSAIRRKITILGTRLDSLQSLLSRNPGKSEKEMNRRKDTLSNLRSKVNQMASTLSMSNFANRDSLLGPDIKPDAMSRTVGLDNSGLVGLQRQIMKEQDEGLEKLEETVISTKHIALAVNEELGLHTRLIDDLDEHVDVTDSRLRVTLLLITSSAEELGSFEQTHQGWLLLLVHAFIRDWYSCFGRGDMAVGQIFIMIKVSTHRGWADTMVRLLLSDHEVTCSNSGDSVSTLWGIIDSVVTLSMGMCQVQLGQVKNQARRRGCAQRTAPHPTLEEKLRM